MSSGKVHPRDALDGTTATMGDPESKQAWKDGSSTTARQAAVPAATGTEDASDAKKKHVSFPKFLQVRPVRWGPHTCTQQPPRRSTLALMRCGLQRSVHVRISWHAMHPSEEILAVLACAPSNLPLSHISDCRELPRDDRVLVAVPPLDAGDGDHHSSTELRIWDVGLGCP